MKREIYLIRIRCVQENFCLHKHEIHKIMGQVAQKGYTLVPLKVYFKGQPS